MAELKNLIVNGASRLNGNIHSSENIILQEGKSILLRPSNPGYTAGIGYDTAGNECIGLWAKNSVTRLRWFAGNDFTTMGYNAMMGITPDFEISKADGTAKGYIGGNLILHSGNFDDIITASDADTLDGKHASDFSLTGHTHSQYASTGHNHSGVYAELDSNGKVPSSQLPSYVDDVLEYANKSNFPSTGETGKIYVALDTNKTYRWGGSEYVEISPSITLGVTESTAYRGDLGKIAYDHSQSSHAYLPLSGGTVTGDIIPSSSNLYLGDENHHWNEIHGNRLHLASSAGQNYGGRIDFGDCEIEEDTSYTYIAEEEDDVLTIKSTIVAIHAGDLINDSNVYRLRIDRDNGIFGEKYSDGDLEMSRNLLEDSATENSGNTVYLVGVTEGGAFSTGLSFTNKVYMQNGNIFATSDERKKDFHGDIECDFEKLKSIPKKYFTWKDGNSDAMNIGTSAQALKEVYPELVSGGEVEGYAVSYEKLSIVALAAVDKLNEKIESMEKKMEEMQKMIDELKQK